MELVKDGVTLESGGPSIQHDCCTYKKGRHMGRRHRVEEAENAVMLPPAGPPGAGRGREGSSLEPSEEAWPCHTWTLDFWRPEL